MIAPASGGQQVGASKWGPASGGQQVIDGLVREGRLFPVL